MLTIIINFNVLSKYLFGNPKSHIKVYIPERIKIGGLGQNYGILEFLNLKKKSLEYLPINNENYPIRKIWWRVLGNSSPPRARQPSL